ncbi:MAG: J domain-containing protein [Alphaproteobacteria bacterium]
MGDATRRSVPSTTVAAEPPPLGRVCDHPECGRPGEYRAPRTRTLTEYYWFCLEHVRDYNKAWDYCRGMTQTEIEEHIREDTVWQRPTWPLGGAGARFRGDIAGFADRFGVFGGAQSPHPHPRHEETSEDRAMRAMDLLPPLTRDALKARYKELVKRFHPDAHGGDTTSEERLKVINEAYKTLMGVLNA